MQKKYVMWNSEQPQDAAKSQESALKEMLYFGENSTNCRFPNIEVNEENQVKLQKLVEEFEEPREIFILLIYFKEICKLSDFETVLVIDKTI